MTDQIQIRSEADIEAVIGEPMEFVRVKIRDALDDAMRDFIARTPLIFVSTIDEHGHIDVSPKGDPPGFVTVDSDGDLLIPERKGNKLTFGFRNILRNGEIGLIFVVPNQRETLRIKGTATLHADPDVVERMRVNGRPALMYTRVSVDECFFHCGKALIRSKVWDLSSWDDAVDSIGARGFASLAGEPEESMVKATEEALEESYAKELY